MQLALLCYNYYAMLFSSAWKSDSNYLPSPELCEYEDCATETQNRFSSLECDVAGEESNPIIIDTSDDDMPTNSISPCHQLTMSKHTKPISLGIHCDTTPESKTTCSESSCDSQEDTQLPTHLPIPLDVLQLPFDIDGNVSYRLSYDPDKRMNSSLDGRPWKTWVTTSQKGFGEYDALLVVKEAISVLILSAVTGNSIKVQIVLNLKKKVKKQYVNAVGYAVFTLIVMQRKNGNSPETANL